jgi:hypothetical protein
MHTRCIGDIRTLRDPEAVVRAIVFARPGEFSLTELPDPVPGPRDAVVQVEAVGICGTDLPSMAMRSLLLITRRRLIPSGQAPGGSCRSDHRRKNQ